MSAPCDVDKVREITFHPLPPNQVEAALGLLGTAAKLQVRQTGPLTLEASYCVYDHCLQELETLLEGNGFHLENSLLIRLKRALVHYTEHVQRENLHSPEVHTKQYMPSIENWEKTPHGDRDATPAEWRQYR